VLLFATYTERLVRQDFTAFVPPGLIDLAVIDELRKGFSGDRAKTRADVLAELEAVTGVAIVESLDYPLNENGTLASSPFAISQLPAVGAGAQALPAPWCDSTTFEVFVADTASLQPFQTNQQT